MMPIAVMSGSALFAIAVVHLLWAAGVNWPVADEKRLARTVAGFKGIERMPPRPASLFVGAATATMAALALELGGALTLPGLPNALALVAGGSASLAFLGRGALGFTARWAELTPEQPFRTLDTRCYSPLCLALGVAFAILVAGYPA